MKSSPTIRGIALLIRQHLGADYKVYIRNNIITVKPLRVTVACIGCHPGTDWFINVGAVPVRLDPDPKLWIHRGYWPFNPDHHLSDPELRELLAIIAGRGVE
jgi:hypothetical protein